MDSRILLIYTGGTIGMVRSEEGYVPSKGFESLLRQRLETAMPSDTFEFDYVEFEELIDSANIQPYHWTALAELIRHNYRNYAGFVVLHGTDTMAFTASALSFMLRGLDKPVIMTGSQIPLAELRNDAKDNLITAMVLARDYPIHEVCLYFNGRLMRGNRTTKANATGFEAFDSPNFPDLGQVGIDIHLHQQPLPPTRQQLSAPIFEPHAVVALKLFPGISADFVSRVLSDPRTRALVMSSFGVGNVPHHNKPLVAALTEASRRGVTIVNITQCMRGRVSQETYATGRVLQEAGVVSGADMTFEAAFTKLHVLLAEESHPDTVRHLVTQNLCGELSLPH